MLIISNELEVDPTWIYLKTQTDKEKITNNYIKIILYL